MTEQIKDFYEGRCIRAYRFLGCHRAERGYRFLVWAPNARAVAVSGDFNGWSREQNPAWRREDGHAVISVVHDLSLARLYGTHALLLKDGEAVCQGPLPGSLADPILKQAYGMDVAAWEKYLASVWQEKPAEKEAL